MHDDERLIPELAGWNNGAGIRLEAWISAIGRYDHAIGYGAVFWPRFVLYDDCVLLYEPDARNYQDWVTWAQGDKTRVETMLNHRHLVDLFPNSAFRPSKEILLWLGQTLKETWSCKVVRDFPERPCEVVLDCKNDVDLAEYQITLFQSKRNR